MPSENTRMYYTPSAIAKKEVLFNVLQPIINGFNDLPQIKFNTTKGRLKYVSCSSPEKIFYSCEAIVYVDYKSNAET